jgi:hypothetical protein
MGFGSGKSRVVPSRTGALQNDPDLIHTIFSEKFSIPSRDPGGEAIVLVLSEVDGEHARLEVDSEPVGHVQHLLPLLHRRLKVLLLAQLLYLARLHRNRTLKKLSPNK